MTSGGKRKSGFFNYIKSWFKNKEKAWTSVNDLEDDSKYGVPSDEPKKNCVKIEENRKKNDRRCDDTTYTRTSTDIQVKSGGEITPIVDKNRSCLTGTNTYADSNTVDWERTGAKPKTQKEPIEPSRSNRRQNDIKDDNHTSNKRPTQYSERNQPSLTHVSDQESVTLANEKRSSKKVISDLPDFPNVESRFNEGLFDRNVPFPFSARFTSEPELISKHMLNDVSSMPTRHYGDTDIGVKYQPIREQSSDSHLYTQGAYRGKNRNEGHTSVSGSRTGRLRSSTSSAISISYISQDEKETVEAQTRHLLDAMWLKCKGKTIIKGVKTELYKLANKNLEHRHNPNIIILKGSGHGCNFVAKMLFAERCIDQQTDGYHLLNKTEWKAVDVENRKAVILIPDASMDEWSTLLKHEIIPLLRESGTDLTVIITTKDTCEKQLQHYIVDATCNKAQPSQKSKQDLFNYLAKKHGVQIVADRENIHMSESGRPIRKITPESMGSILKLVGNLCWVERLDDFFRTHLHEGPMYFHKPIAKHVEEFRNIESNNKLLFLALLCVYVHDSLTQERLNQIRDQCKSLSRGHFSIAARLNVKGIPNDIHLAKKHLNKQNCVIYRYCKMHNLWESAAKEIHEVLRKEIGCLIDEHEGEYMFANENVKNSFMVVVSDFNTCDVISRCDETFLFNVIGQSTEEIFVSISPYEKPVRNKFFERMKNEWLSGQVSKCLNHPVIAKEYVKFMTRNTKHDRKQMLQTVDEVSRFGAIYHGMERNELSLEEADDKNITEVILRSGKWKKIRRHDIWKKQETEALIHAAELSNKHTFDCFVRHGTPITKGVLIAALRSGSVDILLAIIHASKLNDIDWRDGILEALHVYCCDTKSPDAEEMFRQLCSNKGSVINFNTNHVRPLLHEAVSKNNKQMIKLLLEHPSCSETTNVDIIWTNAHIPPISHTALTLATELGFGDTVEYLLEMGANQRQEGVTFRPVRIAAKHGNVTILEKLVEQNLTIVNEKDTGRIPLLWACENGDIEAITYLISKSCLQVNSSDNRRQTPLHIAVENKHACVVSYLLRSGADSQAKDSEGNTPLQLAVNLKHSACEELLRQHTRMRNVAVPVHNSVHKRKSREILAAIHI